MSELKINGLESYSYSEYKDIISQLAEKGKNTSSIDSDSLLNYSKLNLHRMNRIDKTSVLSSKIKNTLSKIDHAQTWLVISEGWCGDAAQSLPWINKMAQSTRHLNLKIILRDKNLDIIDRFLTNGGRSIPKLIIIENDQVRSDWGPRPSTAQKLYTQMKNEGLESDEINLKMQTWYNNNKGADLQAEFYELLA